jgi:hypothetical protein
MLPYRARLKGLRPSSGRFFYTLREAQAIIEEWGKAYNICAAPTFLWDTVSQRPRRLYNLQTELLSAGS